LIKNGKYGTTVISCIAANGICHRNQECSTCFHAEKYEHLKNVFALSAKCEWKNENNCLKFFKECNSMECTLILNSLN
jgi:hypothetical protein